MKKRIVSVLLAVLMLFTAVVSTGCSSEEASGESANTSTREIIALNMYILTEDSTTYEAANNVQMAINEILLPNYKTMLKINYLKADEYWPAVEAALEETAVPSSTNASVVGTEGMAFPELIEYIFRDSTTDIELSQPQIDIFVVNDHEKYVQLANQGKLKGLNQYISYDSKILTTSIYPTILTSAKVGSETYGIPTNFGMEQGEYTYLVYNEDLLKKYGFEVKQVNDFASNNFAKFLAAVKEGEPDIWPLSEPFGIAGAEYYNGDPAFVAVASQFNYMANGATPTFLTMPYTNNIRKRVEYKKLGYYPEKPIENAKYAIRLEKSTKLLNGEGEKRWTDEDGTTYVRYLFDIPRVTVEDAFTSAMCISATSPVPDRAMEIITLFQTNSRLANLLQYGIEDVNYQIDERDDTLLIVDDTYAMDNIVTGNTYIKYSPDNDKEYLKNSIASNLGSAPSGFLGVNLEFTSGSDKSQFEFATVLLSKAKEAIDNGADVQEVINITSRELENLGCVRASAVSDYGGIFGRVQAAQRNQGQIISQNLAISDEILEYNEDYGIFMKRQQNNTADEAETETVDGETADGEAGEGTAEAVGDETQTTDATEEAAE